MNILCQGLPPRLAAHLTSGIYSWGVVLEEEEESLLVPKGGGATGTVVFKQRAVEGSETWITGVIKGLNASAMHGWHVHEKAVNETEGCGSTGGHFNPFGTVHGALEDPPDRRHVGDLGNFRTDTKGVGVVKVADRLVSLVGYNNVIGRGLVIHGGQDDLGRGGDEGSMANGNAGPRVGCCTITQVYFG